MTLTTQTVQLSQRARAFSVENLLHEPDIVKTYNCSLNYVTKKYDCSENCVARRKEGTEKRKNMKVADNGSGLRIELCSSELWDRFNEIGTEMIITKAGRRMFPTLKVRFHGLSSANTYIVYMDIVPVGQARYRYIYHSSQWMTSGPGDTFSINNTYIHPDSPATGQLWTSQGHISFDKVKLTNNKKPLVRGQISLHSMHKYQPRVHILEVPDTQCLALNTHEDVLRYIEEHRDRTCTCAFSQTMFITVTAYQNQEITRLKIQSNPFAKGFRDTSRPKEEKPFKAPVFRPCVGLSPAASPVHLRPDLVYALHMTSGSGSMATDLRNREPQRIPVRILIPPQQHRLS